METITLYHGTPKSSFDEIVEDGFLIGPVFLTPCKKTAEDYASNNSPDFVVFEVEVCRSELNIDPEFVNEHDVDLSLEAGSVCTRQNVCIKNSFLTFYEDYCEVEQH